MDDKDYNVVNKLIVLFFMDKMDVPLTEPIIVEACYYQNPWLEYMDLMQTLNQLVEANFLFVTKRDNMAYYSMTPDGRTCLMHFFARVPASIRSEITEFVKENRMLYRRKQEYSASYHMNADKSYTVQLKIVDSVKTSLDLKITVPNKSIAKSIAKKWPDSAAIVYTGIYEQLVE